MTKPWAEKWTELKPLGGGGQGDTVLVKSNFSDLPQAVLKLLKAQKALDPKARGRMAREVTNLKALRSAGGKVPHVLDSNTEQFEVTEIPLYFVMEYIEGQTLANLVQNAKGLSFEQSIGIAKSLCATMQIAIKEGIIHRDIKPENIIVQNATDACMVDFGLSFNEDDKETYTSADESLDNKFISLPERRGPAENKRDPRSDLTGICAILFYCLTGCSPRNLLDSHGRPPHQWREYSFDGKVPDEFRRGALNLFFSRGLSYEIDSRFQTVEELSTRLEELLAPRSEEVSEPFGVILAREVLAMRKNDRATQLNECFQKLASAPLQNAIGQKLNEISQEFLRQGNVFHIASRVAIQAQNQKTGDKDWFAFWSYTVNVSNHPHFIQIHYRAYSVGQECEIQRVLHYGAGSQHPQPIDKPVVVLRYQGDAGPNTQILVADHEKAGGKAIALIGEKIHANK